jgi:hypothetical protein
MMNPDSHGTCSVARENTVRVVSSRAATLVRSRSGAVIRTNSLREHHFPTSNLGKRVALPASFGGVAAPRLADA